MTLIILTITYKRIFFITIIISAVVILSNFAIAQDKSVIQKPEPRVQRIAGLNAGFIVALIHDGVGGAWIGTEDDGTFHYQVDGNVSQFTTKNGLGDNNGYALAIDKLGRLAQQTRFDSDKPIIVTKNKFDQAGRLTNISHTGNGKTYADYDLTWDDANRITDFDFTYLNGPVKRNESNYRYDKTSQLIAANYNFMQNEMYDFDLNGNRKKAEIQGKNESYKTGEYNRLLSDENYRYEYDQEGNRISKIDKDNKTTKYLWDHRNRLTKVQTPTDTVEYIYDYQNRLVKRTDNQNVTTFIHDDWQIIATLDSKNNVKDRYLWGTKQDELICNNNNWTLPDHLNTIRDTIKSNGTVVSHLEYNAFGKLISETKNELFFFGYTGKLFDETSDLQWNINRWYDANVGRWMSEDPIGFNSNDVDLYRYVNHRVLVGKDSNGLSFSCVGASISAITVMFLPIAPPFGGGVALTAARYICGGYSPSTGNMYCGSCVVLTLTNHLSSGFYFSIGFNGSLLFNPFTDNNRPDPGIAFELGTGLGVNLPNITPIVADWSVDVSLPSGDTTITTPGFGFAYGIYMSIRFSGSCTGCTKAFHFLDFESIKKELQFCLDDIEKSVNNATQWIKNKMNNPEIIINGSPMITHKIQGTGNKHSNYAIDGGITQ